MQDFDKRDKWVEFKPFYQVRTPKWAESISVDAGLLVVVIIANYWNQKDRLIIMILQKLLERFLIFYLYG